MKDFVDWVEGELGDETLVGFIFLLVAISTFIFGLFAVLVT